MGRVTTLTSNRGQVERVVEQADLVIGAVLVPGGRAPVVVSEDMVASMRPGAVVVDIAIDQGGCFATSKPTTHAEPTYVMHGVTHYCVTNMPGAVPRTSTFALNAATLPYLKLLAERGLDALAIDPGFAAGLNVSAGRITCEAVTAALGLK
jgi:alanine dehydrogenase